MPDPVPGAGQVRVDVEASGVQFIETVFRRGVGVGPHEPPELPYTPGAEVAGVVGAVGPGVDARWLGRRVVAQLGTHGGYAERALAGVDLLHPIPDHVDADTAVAMITTGATAQGVLGVARLSADDVVLVMSAAGGLGSLFVQAAHRAARSWWAWRAARRRWRGSGSWAPTSRWTTGRATGPRGCVRHWTGGR